MNRITYQNAGSVADMIHTRFEQNFDCCTAQREHPNALPPEKEYIEKLLDMAFWASLRREEGRSPKISLAFISPDHAGSCIMFKERLPFEVSYLTKLSPGVERSGIHIGVWHDQGELYIWGNTTEIPNLCFVLEVAEPGLLVIKYRRLNGFGKFVNVAILTGDEFKMVDDNSPFADGPDIIRNLMQFTSPTAQGQFSNLFILLAVSMRRHMRGGTMLVVPDDSKNWKHSIIQPLQYGIEPAYEGILQKINQPEDNFSIQGEIDHLAGLTAIDGATIITASCRLLAFGAKISANGTESLSEMIATESALGEFRRVIPPTLIGGTRHMSAARFVQDQKDCFAMVASQDGRFTLFFWSENNQKVQAHRIDSLLL
jgi:hypothetical protein